MRKSFSKLKNQAIEQMREMNCRASKSVDHSQQKSNAQPNISTQNLLGNIPFPATNDNLIIMGILLILGEDCRDIWLFLALLYIMM